MHNVFTSVTAKNTTTEDTMAVLTYFRKLYRCQNRTRLSIPPEIAIALDPRGTGSVGLVWNGKVLTIAPAPETVR